MLSMPCHGHRHFRSRRHRDDSRQERYDKDSRRDESLSSPPKVVSKAVTRLPIVQLPPTWNVKVRCTANNGGLKNYSKCSVV